MKCKHNLSTEDALNRGWCKCCKSLDCIKIKDHNNHCHKCNNTGITDCNGDDVIICNNCIWGIRFAVEQQEYENLAGEFDEMFLTG